MTTVQLRLKISQINCNIQEHRASTFQMFGKVIETRWRRPAASGYDRKQPMPCRNHLQTTRQSRHKIRFLWRSLHRTACDLLVSIVLGPLVVHRSLFAFIDIWCPDQTFLTSSFQLVETLSPNPCQKKHPAKGVCISLIMSCFNQVKRLDTLHKTFITRF